VAIRGSINSSDIERGFARIELGMDSVKGKAKSFTADLSRMSAISIGLANSLIGVGVQGASALVKLASGAPAVAGDMARIGVATDRLQRALGEDLAPAFDWFSAKYEKFVSDVEGGGFGNALVKAFAISDETKQTIFNNMKTWWEEFKTLNPMLFPEETEIPGDVGGGEGGGGGGARQDASIYSGEAEGDSFFANLWNYIIRRFNGENVKNEVLDPSGGYF